MLFTWCSSFSAHALGKAVTAAAEAGLPPAGSRLTLVAAEMSVKVSDFLAFLDTDTLDHT